MDVYPKGALTQVSWEVGVGLAKGDGTRQRSWRLDALPCGYLTPDGECLAWNFVEPPPSSTSPYWPGCRACQGQGRIKPSLLAHGARGPRAPGVEGFAASGLRLWFSAHFPEPSHLSPIPGPLDIREAPSCAGMDENGCESYFVKLNSCPRR